MSDYVNMGDYEGTYKSKVFKSIFTFYDITIETMSKRTGFTEEHLEGILRQDIIEKPMGKRLLSALDLTNNDYSWINLVLHEVEFDRMKRLRALEEIRFNQRQLALEKERVKKDVEKSKKETISKTRVKEGRRTIKKRDKGKQENNKQEASKQNSSKSVVTKERRKVKKRDKKG